MVEDFKEIAEFISSNLTGCKFVGISSDNEVFVKFDYDDPEMQNGASLLIKRKFPYVSRVAIVYQPSIEEVNTMLEDLNRFLDQDNTPKGNLLDIGDF